MLTYKTCERCRSDRFKIVFDTLAETETVCECSNCGLTQEI